MKRALFIFRRDLRLHDNTGLIFALQNAHEVIPAFIFTPEQVEKNPYRSDHCLQFMIESLEDLSKQLAEKKGRLYLFHGQPTKIVENCIDKLDVDAVVVNRDYTPYSIARDAKLAALCRKHQIPFYSFDDALLHPPEETVKSDGKPYSIFTPYFRHASRLPVAKPVANRMSNYARMNIVFAEKSSFFKKILPGRSEQMVGGRQTALKILHKSQRFSQYRKTRDFPEKDATTHLSAHLKFTTCSPREAYWTWHKKLGPHAELIRALFWRDFFTGIAFFYPHIFKGAFHKKFDRLRWNDDKKAFRRWCEGKTGFPIVDAGMREMNATGFMHNRVRMIVASFLTKDLHIDWRLGEKYFAQHLVDYDPAVNNGNWQWSASTGCDAQPYFRIFNPWSQQEKFDPDCIYIKRWIPELAQVSAQDIHKWHLKPARALCPAYLAPMVDHAKEAKKSLRMYKK